MPTAKEVKALLVYLQDTMNFEYVAKKVFERIAHGQGHGMLILQGPSGIGNKSFFLKMIKAFQSSVPAGAKAHFSDDLQRLLAELSASHYQCVDIKERCPLGSYPNVYRVPLHVAIPLSILVTSQMRGLVKGRKLLILCDDLHEFINHNPDSNMTFLRQLAQSLDSLKEITFLGAYTLDYYGKGLDKTVLSDYVLALGYD